MNSNEFERELEMAAEKNIKIPIKDIVLSAMSKKHAYYDDEFVMYLRRYFIAALNLKYIRPGDLIPLSEKFCSRISIVHYRNMSIAKELPYEIENNELCLPGNLKILDEELYQLCCFASIFNVLSEVSHNDNSSFVDKVFTFIVAQKIYNYDLNASPIIMPRTDELILEGNVFQLRAGYNSLYNKEICLFKMLCVALSINDNKIIKDAHFHPLYEVLDDSYKEDSKVILLFNTIKMVNSLHKALRYDAELELIEKYQRTVNGMFESINTNYFAFAALIFTDDLRIALMKEMEDKVQDEND